MKKTIIVIIAMIVTVNCIYAENDYGTSASTFLKFGIGAKAAAMGNAAITNIFEPSAIFWNPALLADIQAYNVQLTHNQGFMGTTQNFLGACFPLNFGNIGVAVNYFSSAEMTRTVAIPSSGYSEMGKFSNSDLAIMASYSKDILNNMGLGITAKYINQTLDKSSGSAIAVDFGLFTKFDLFNLGLAIRNLGTTMKLENEEYPLPFQVQAGASANFDNLLLSLVVGTLGENKVTFGLGGEYNILNAVSLRAGYHSGYGDIEGTFKGFTGGVGLYYEGIHLDYAFTPYAELGNSHQLSLSYAWDLGRAKKSSTETQDYDDIEPVEKPKSTESTSRDDSKTTSTPGSTDLYEPGKCYAILYNSYDNYNSASSAKSILLKRNVQAIMIVEKTEQGTGKINYQLISGCYETTQLALDFLNQNNNWINSELKLTKNAVIIK